MKRSSKRIMAILGTAALAVGIMALPAIAETTRQGSAWFSEMHGYMQKNFSPEQHQALMNSREMQDLHNSQEMQKAMQTGDVKKMQELMNSDPAVKAQMGQDNLDRMNELMSNFGGSMMSNSGGRGGSHGIMMNGIRNAMGSQFNN